MSKIRRRQGYGGLAGQRGPSQCGALHITTLCQDRMDIKNYDLEQFNKNCGHLEAALLHFGVVSAPSQVAADVLSR